MILILLVVLIVITSFGGYRMGPGFGYFGGGGLSLILFVLLICMVLGVVHG